MRYKLSKKSTNNVYDVEKLLSWRYSDFNTNIDEDANKVYGLHLFSNNVFAHELSDVGDDIQGLFLNIDWKIHDECHDLYSKNDRIFKEFSSNFQISSR